MLHNIRAIFFDFSDTLAYDVPRQEDLLASAAGDFGLAVAPAAARRGLYAAGQFWTAAMAARPLGERTPDEQQELFREYDRRALAAAGVDVSGELALRVFERLMQRSRAAGHRIALYDDVLWGLAALRKSGYRLGIISNLDRSLHRICNSLGLTDAMDVIVSAADAASAKPGPAIFAHALAAVGVSAAQSLYVGDQLEIDIAGAAAAGITPVLMDRDGLFPEFAGLRAMSMAAVGRLVGAGT